MKANNVKEVVYQNDGVTAKGVMLLKINSLK